MEKEKLEVDYFNGYKIFDEKVLAQLEKKYGSRSFSLITKDETMGITISMADLRNLNHALRQTIILYPNKELIITSRPLQEQYFNPDDDFVGTYLYLVNYWTNNRELTNPIFRKILITESA